MERTFTREPEELPVSAEYCPQWINTATEGTISSAKWSYDWNQIRARWHPQYFFRWNAVDSHIWDDGYITEEYQSSMESPKVDCVIEGMDNPKEEEVESQTSDTTGTGCGRCRFTIFLVAIGIFMTAAVIFPLIFFLLSAEEIPGERVGRISAELSLVKINFTDQMLNKSSEEYRALSQTFELEMDNLFGNSSLQTNFITCKVTNITEGPKVHYHMLFEVINRRIPSTNQMKEIIHSVERDKNDTTLGVLGELRFRLESVKFKDKSLVSKTQIEDKRNTSVINNKSYNHLNVHGDNSNTKDSKTIDLHNNFADVEPFEQTTKEMGISFLGNTTAINIMQSTEKEITEENTEAEKGSRTEINIMNIDTVKVLHANKKTDIQNFSLNKEPNERATNELNIPFLENTTIIQFIETTGVLHTTYKSIPIGQESTTNVNVDDNNLTTFIQDQDSVTSDIHNIQANKVLTEQTTKELVIPVLDNTTAFKMYTTEADNLKMKKGMVASKEMDNYHNLDVKATTERTAKELDVSIRTTEIPNTIYESTRTRQESATNLMESIQDKKGIDFHNILANNEATSKTTIELGISLSENKTVKTENKSEVLNTAQVRQTREELTAEKAVAEFNRMNNTTSTPSSFMNTTPLETTAKEPTDISTKNLLSATGFNKNDVSSDKKIDNTNIGFENTTALEESFSANTSIVVTRNDTLIFHKESATRNSLEATSSINIYNTSSDNQLSSTLDYFYDYFTVTDNSSTYKPDMNITVSTANFQEDNISNMLLDQTRTTIKIQETTTDKKRITEHAFESLLTNVNVTKNSDTSDSRKHLSTTDTNKVNVTEEQFTDIADSMTFKPLVQSKTDTTNILSADRKDSASSPVEPEIVGTTQSYNGVSYSNITSFNETKFVTASSSTLPNLDTTDMAESPIVTANTNTSFFSDMIRTTTWLPSPTSTIMNINKEKIKSINGGTKDYLNRSESASKAMKNASLFASYNISMNTNNIENTSSILDPLIVNEQITRNYTQATVTSSSSGRTNTENTTVEYLIRADKEYYKAFTTKENLEGSSVKTGYNIAANSDIHISEITTQSFTESQDDTYQPPSVEKPNLPLPDSLEHMSLTNNTKETHFSTTDNVTKLMVSPPYFTIMDETTNKTEPTINQTMPTRTTAQSNSMIKYSFQTNDIPSDIKISGRNNQTVTISNFYDSTSSGIRNTGATLFQTSTAEPVSMKIKTAENNTKHFHDFKRTTNIQIPPASYTKEIGESSYIEFSETINDTGTINVADDRKTTTGSTIMLKVSNSSTIDTLNGGKVSHASDSSDLYEYVYDTYDASTETNSVTFDGFESSFKRTSTIPTTTANDSNHVLFDMTTENPVSSARDTGTSLDMFAGAILENTSATNDTKNYHNNLFKNVSHIAASATNYTKQSYDDKSSVGKLSVFNETNEPNNSTGNIANIETNDTKLTSNWPFNRETISPILVSNYTNSVYSNVSVDVILQPTSVIHNAMLSYGNATDTVNSIDAGLTDRNLTETSRNEPNSYNTAPFNYKDSEMLLNNHVPVKNNTIISHTEIFHAHAVEPISDRVTAQTMSVTNYNNVPSTTIVELISATNYTVNSNYSDIDIVITEQPISVINYTKTSKYNGLKTSRIKNNETRSIYHEFDDETSVINDTVHSLDNKSNAINIYPFTVTTNGVVSNRSIFDKVSHQPVSVINDSESILAIGFIRTEPNSVTNATVFLKDVTRSTETDYTVNDTTLASDRTINKMSAGSTFDANHAMLDDSEVERVADAPTHISPVTTSKKPVETTSQISSDELFGKTIVDPIPIINRTSLTKLDKSTSKPLSFSVTNSMNETINDKKDYESANVTNGRRYSSTDTTSNDALISTKRSDINELIEPTQRTDTTTKQIDIVSESDLIKGATTPMPLFVINDSQITDNSASDESNLKEIQLTSASPRSDVNIMGETNSQTIVTSILSNSMQTNAAVTKSVLSQSTMIDNSSSDINSDSRTSTYLNFKIIPIDKIPLEIAGMTSNSSVLYPEQKSKDVLTEINTSLLIKGNETNEHNHERLSVTTDRTFTDLTKSTELAIENTSETSERLHAENGRLDKAPLNTSMLNNGPPLITSNETNYKKSKVDVIYNDSATETIPLDNINASDTRQSNNTASMNDSSYLTTNNTDFENTLLKSKANNNNPDVLYIPPLEKLDSKTFKHNNRNWKPIINILYVTPLSITTTKGSSENVQNIKDTVSNMSTKILHIPPLTADERLTTTQTLPLTDLTDNISRQDLYLKNVNSSSPASLILNSATLSTSSLSNNYSDWNGKIWFLKNNYNTNSENANLTREGINSIYREKLDATQVATTDKSTINTSSFTLRSLTDTKRNKTNDEKATVTDTLSVRGINDVTEKMHIDKQTDFLSSKINHESVSSTTQMLTSLIENEEINTNDQGTNSRPLSTNAVAWSTRFGLLTYMNYLQSTHSVYMQNSDDIHTMPEIQYITNTPSLSKHDIRSTTTADDSLSTRVSSSGRSKQSYTKEVTNELEVTTTPMLTKSTTSTLPILLVETPAQKQQSGSLRSKTSDNNNKSTIDDFVINNKLATLRGMTTDSSNNDQVIANEKFILKTETPFVESITNGSYVNTEVPLINVTDINRVKDAKSVLGDYSSQKEARNYLHNSTYLLHDTAELLNASSTFNNSSNDDGKTLPNVLKGVILKDDISSTSSFNLTRSKDSVQKETEKPVITEVVKYLWDLGDSSVLRQNSSSFLLPIPPTSMSPFSFTRKDHTAGVDKIPKQNNITTRFKYLWDLGDSYLQQNYDSTVEPTETETTSMKRNISVPSTSDKVFKPTSTNRPVIKYLWSLGNNVLSSLLGGMSAKESDTELREENTFRMNNLLATDISKNEFQSAGKSVLKPKDIFLAYNKPAGYNSETHVQNPNLPGNLPSKEYENVTKFQKEHSTIKDDEMSFEFQKKSTVVEINEAIVTQSTQQYNSNSSRLNVPDNISNDNHTNNSEYSLNYTRDNSAERILTNLTLQNTTNNTVNTSTTTGEVAGITFPSVEVNVTSWYWNLNNSFSTGYHGNFDAYETGNETSKNTSIFGNTTNLPTQGNSSFNHDQALEIARSLVDSDSEFYRDNSFISNETISNLRDSSLNLNMNASNFSALSSTFSIQTPNNNTVDDSRNITVDQTISLDNSSTFADDNGVQPGRLETSTTQLNDTGYPAIQYWQSNEPYIGSALTMAWNAENIGGWTNIFLTRHFPNKKLETIATIHADTMTISYGNSTLFVSPRTIFDQTSATVYLDIRVLQCQDEAVYTVRITSDLGQIQRQTELHVLREPTAKIVTPKYLFSDETLDNIKCEADIGYPYGEIVMRVSYDEGTNFENYFVPREMMDVQIAETCREIVSVNFTGFFDRVIEKNLTRIQCGVYDSNAIRSEDGYLMSPEKPVRIIPANICEAKGSQLIHNPYEQCGYIECPQRKLKTCPVSTCFDQELLKCK